MTTDTVKVELIERTVVRDDAEGEPASAFAREAAEGGVA